MRVLHPGSTLKIGTLCGWDADNPTATWGDFRNNQWYVPEIVERLNC